MTFTVGQIVPYLLVKLGFISNPTDRQTVSYLFVKVRFITNPSEYDKITKRKSKPSWPHSSLIPIGKETLGFVKKQITHHCVFKIKDNHLIHPQSFINQGNHLIRDLSHASFAQLSLSTILSSLLYI